MTTYDAGARRDAFYRHLNELRTLIRSTDDQYELTSMAALLEELGALVRVHQEVAVRMAQRSAE